MTTTRYPQGESPDLPNFQKQLRYNEVLRFLIALHWLDRAGHPLKGRTLETSRSAEQTQEGSDTAWARRAHANALRRLRRHAERLEGILGDPDLKPPEQPRCAGCGQKLGYDNKNFCSHCGVPTKKKGEGGSPTGRAETKRPPPHRADGHHNEEPPTPSGKITHS